MSTSIHHPMSFKSFKASSGAMGGSAVVRTGRSAGGWEHSVKASAIWLKKAMIPGTFPVRPRSPAFTRLPRSTKPYKP